MRQHLGMPGIVVACLVERLLVQWRRDDGRGPAGLCQPHALLDRLERKPSAIGTQYARTDRRALGVGLQKTEIWPIAVLGAHLRDREAGAERSLCALQCGAAADDQQAQIALRDPVLQSDAGLDDDLRSDPGRIAHGDRKMARGHVGFPILSN